MPPSTITEESRFLATANRTKITIQGSLNDGVKIQLQDVYYVSELKSKIISEHQCTVAGLTLSKKAEKLILQKGDLILHVHNDPRYNLCYVNHKYLEQYMHHHNLRATPEGNECKM
jgi:hypothetical protein